jgi:uncharacterized protein YbjT (DUF2867 family)
VTNGARVRAITRSHHAQRSGLAPQIDHALADFEDVSSLTRALSGVDGAYIFIPPAILSDDYMAFAERVANTLAEAAVKAKLPRVVALSSTGAQYKTGTGLYQISYFMESAFRRAALPRTFLRPAEFIDNWSPLLWVAHEHSVLPSMHVPLDRKFRQVAAQDVGVAAAELLLDHDGAEERIVHLEGPESYAPTDVAAVFSSLLAKPVVAIAPPRESWVDTLMKAGMGRSYAMALAELWDAANESRAEFEDGIGEIRQGSTSLHDVLADAARAIATAA